MGRGQRAAGFTQTDSELGVWAHCAHHRHRQRQLALPPRTRTPPTQQSMTPRPAATPATIAAQALAPRARPSRQQPRHAIQPGDQATSTPTTTDANWGHFKPSHRGQCKPSFSPVHYCAARSAWAWVRADTAERAPGRLTARSRNGAVAHDQRHHHPVVPIALLAGSALGRRPHRVSSAPRVRA